MRTAIAGGHREKNHPGHRLRAREWPDNGCALRGSITAARFLGSVEEHLGQALTRVGTVLLDEMSARRVGDIGGHIVAGLPAGLHGRPKLGRVGQRGRDGHAARQPHTADSHLRSPVKDALAGCTVAECYNAIAATDSDAQAGSKRTPFWTGGATHQAIGVDQTRAVARVAQQSVAP